jgi:hemerythrin
MANKQKRFIVPLDPEIHKKISEAKEKTGMSMTFIFNAACQEWLDRHIKNDDKEI